MFEADLQELLGAVEQWAGELKNFQESVSPIARPVTISDGTGPVACLLGRRFDHRLGGEGGIGWASNAYITQFEAILLGLIESAKDYADTEAAGAATIDGVAP